MEFINVILWSGTRALGHLSPIAISFPLTPILIPFVSSTRDTSLSLIFLITTLIIGSSVISAYLSHYLPSEQPWRAGGASFSHFISRHARSCLTGILSLDIDLSIPEVSLYLSYTITKKRDDHGTPALWWNRGNRADAKGQDGDISCDLRRLWISREINSWPDPIDVLIPFLPPNAFVHWVFVARTPKPLPVLDARDLWIMNRPMIAACL